MEDIEDLYVPFDEMMNHLVIEGKLLEEFKKQHISEFYGIIGKSGSGKTSILNYLLALLSKEKSDVFCIKLSNFSEIKEPKDLLRNIIKKIFDMSTQFLELSPEQKEEAKKILAHQYSFADRKEKSITLEMRAWFNIIPMIVGLEGSVSTALKDQSEMVTHGSPSTEDLLTYLDQIVNILKTQAKMRHVIIMIDETDKIRESGESEPTVDSAINFFENNLPVLASTGCTYVFVLNEQYNDEKFKKRITDNYFSPLLHVPSFETENSLKKIIEKRTQAACGDIRFEDVWEEFTITTLFNYYKKNSLRMMMPICNNSVQKAREEGSETISISHIENALLEITS